MVRQQAKQKKHQGVDGRERRRGGDGTRIIRKQNQQDKQRREGDAGDGVRSGLRAGRAQARRHRRDDWNLNASGDKLVRAAPDLTTSCDVPLLAGQC